MEIIETEIRCSNCNSILIEKYCSFCGQKQFSHDNFSLKHFFNESIGEIFNFDNKVFRSLKPLLFQPGTLTLEYLSGRHQYFIKPFSLFLFINLFFFLFGYKMGIMKWKIEGIATKSEHIIIDEHIQKHGLIKEAYITLFNDQLSEYQRSMFFVIIPVFALFMMLFYLRTKRFYAEYLVYSIHFHSSYLILLPITLVAMIFLSIGFDKITGASISKIVNQDSFISFYALFLMVAYHIIALRKVFHEKQWIVVTKSLVISCFNIFIMIFLAQRILFWITFQTI